MSNGNERGGDAPRTRTLHPIRSRDAWRISETEAEGLRRICVLDTETTGLDVDRHQVIEICAAMVMVGDVGRVRGIRSIGSGYVDPGEPLDPTITELTGITDADLSGQDIDRDKLASFIEECEGVLSFNCAFDRPFVEKLLPNLKDVKWGCAMADVPWRKLGFEPGPQGFLVMQAGKFMPAAHRAQDDVLALVELLAHQCRDGGTVMAKALKAMDAPAWRFEARNAPYRFKDELRQHRYRWAADAGRKVWHKHVRDGEYDAELGWYRTTIGQEPAIVELPATQRYRAERTWKDLDINLIDCLDEDLLQVAAAFALRLAGPGSSLATQIRCAPADAQVQWLAFLWTQFEQADRSSLSSAFEAWRVIELARQSHA